MSKRNQFHEIQESTIVVTGGSRGLGKAITEQLVELGAQVIVLDLQAPDTSDAVTFYETDVTNENSVKEAFKHINKSVGKLDVLINNASNYSSITRESFDKLSLERWQRTFSINVQGVFLVTREALPLIEAGSRKSIINISSDAPIKGLPMALDYVTSKGAILPLTRALARELGDKDIRVNALAPGYLKHDDAVTWSKERDDLVCKARSIKRSQTPNDITGAVLFLCSDSSRFVTGQTIVIDGGEVFV